MSGWPFVSPSSDAGAQAAFQSAAQAGGLSVRSLAVLSQIQLALANLLQGAPAGSKPLGDITRYGAVPNSTAAAAGNVTAFAAAMADFAAGNIPSVYVPPGVFYVNDAVQCVANVVLYGAGYSSAIQVLTAGFATPVVQPARAAIVTAYNVDNVTVTSLRVVGTLALANDQTYAPTLMYYNTCRNFKVWGCWLENNNWQGIFAGGLDGANTGVDISFNTFSAVGAPNTYTGLEAINLYATGGRCIGNYLVNCGIAIGTDGVKLTVEGNVIINPVTVGIGLGDGGNSYATTTVTGNVIETTDTASVHPHCIVVEGNVAGFETADGLVLIASNALRVNGRSGTSSKAILHEGAGNVEITGNTIEIYVRGAAIELTGSTQGSRVGLFNNEVRLFTPSGTSGGIGGNGAQGPGTSLTVYGSGNRVFGFTRARGEYAIDFNQSGGGAVVCFLRDSIAQEGYVRYPIISYENGEVDGVAHLGLNTGVGPLELYQTVGMQTMLAPIFELTLASDTASLTGVLGAFPRRLTRIRVAPQTGTSDDLATISGGKDGDTLEIEVYAASNTITVKHGTGNIKCGSDRTLNSIYDLIVLKNRGGVLGGANGTWLMASYADNA